MSARRFAPSPLVAALLTAASLAAPAASAQVVPAPPSVPPPMERVSLSGPRFGITFLGGALTDSLAAHNVDIAPVITQFGWQFEKQFYAIQGGPSAVTEWVVLVGGMEQGTFLPSLSWITGLRTPGGAEFGVGPNLSVAGAALVLAGGFTTRVGALNIPLNLAVVPGKTGVRVSVLAGFTARTVSYDRSAPVRAPRVPRRGGAAEWPRVPGTAAGRPVGVQR